MRNSIVPALLLAAVTAYGQGGPQSPAPLRWQRLESGDGSFSVLMPGKATFKTQTLKGKNGRPAQYSSYMVDLGRSAYMVSYSDYDEQTSISLDGAVEGVLSSWKEPKVIGRRHTTLYGHDAQIVDFTSKDFRVTVRVFAVGKRLYQLGFVQTRDELVPANAEKFMDSFVLQVH